MTASGFYSVFLEPPRWLLVVLWLSFAYVVFRSVAVGLLHSAAVRAWVLALLHRVPISLLRLTVLGWRGYDARKLVRSCIIAPGTGSGWSPSVAEAHLRRGGDPEKVAVALVAAAQGGIDLAVEDLCAVDLRREDPLQWVECRRRPSSSGGQTTAPSDGLKKTPSGRGEHGN